ncbi:MAG: hypothetical protein MMC33_002489 [Icmadophila ericetorum]|nr:hypothetical protein [Icmadophila ericetorum]
MSSIARRAIIQKGPLVELALRPKQRECIAIFSNSNITCTLAQKVEAYFQNERTRAGAVLFMLELIASLANVSTAFMLPSQNGRGTVRGDLWRLVISRLHSSNSDEDVWDAIDEVAKLAVESQPAPLTLRTTDGRAMNYDVTTGRPLHTERHLALGIASVSVQCPYAGNGAPDHQVTITTVPRAVTTVASTSGSDAHTEGEPQTQQRIGAAATSQMQTLA